MERVAESEIIPNRHVFVSIFGWEIEEKVEKYSQRGYCSYTITYLKKISATKMNFEKPPAGGGARGWIRNRPKSARLHFRFWTINQGKCREHSAMVSIMQEIHVLFIKLYILSNRSTCAHNLLPESLARDEGVICIICMLVGWLESAGFGGSSTGNFTIEFILSLLCVSSSEFQKTLRRKFTKIYSN